MIALACDHGALTLKEHLKAYLEGKGIPCKDFGTFTAESCDYPDFVGPAAKAVAAGECEKGIVLCTTGIGASMAANKVKGIRCALCHEAWSAEMTRRHNDANMLSIGAGVTGPNLAERIVDAFLNTEFEGGRHQRRIDKVMALEE
ncbi:MAG: ribose 5-phosphate isomerase B [Oscillospiraceae bacterium]